MSPPAPAVVPRQLWLALRRPENRVSAAFTAAVALVVVGLSQLPLEAGFAVDARRHAGWSAVRHADFIGFGAPADPGRDLSAPRGRVVFNRPLPSPLSLEIAGRARPGPLRVTVSVGAERHAVRFGPGGATRRLELANPDGSREITIAVRDTGGRTFTLERLAVDAP